MNLHLDSNHSLFGLSPKVAEFFNDFSKQEDLSYFQFARYYTDRTELALLSRVDLLQKFLDRGWSSLSSIKEENKSRCTYTFYWDEELPETPVSLARASCNIHHGMTILRRSHNFYDMIAFARDKPCSNPGGYYLTRLKALEDFTFSFERAFGDILKNPRPHLMAPPPHQQDPNGPLIFLGNRNIEIQGRTGPSHITPREFDCLQLWTRRLTLKEIARFLEISPRTVETLLERSRIRTGLSLPELSRILKVCP